MSSAFATRPAGAGAGDISGYVVEQVHYTLDAYDPQLLGSVDLVLDRPATNVDIVVAGEQVACTVTDRHATCEARAASLHIADLDSLTVVASA
jgi:hypothetical protein